MIRIVTDTVAGLPQDILDRYRIPCVPQYVIFGEESLREYVDLSPAEFYARQASVAELPHTSAPSPGDFEVLFSRLLAEDPDAPILCIHPSAEFSGTVRSAIPAAQMFPAANITIFDTRTASLGQGLMVLEAARLAEAGAGLEAILARLEQMRALTRAFFIVDTLDYLARGGRIGKAAHLLGAMLDLKPLLHIEDGMVASHSKHRTHHRALEALVGIVLEQAQGRAGLQLGIAHAVDEPEARALADRLCAELSPEVFLMAELGPAIGVHVGPGTLAVCWNTLPG